MWGSWGERKRPDLIRWEEESRLREAGWPWTLPKGVLSLNYPKDSLIRQFLLEGKAAVDPEGRLWGQDRNHS